MVHFRSETVRKKRFRKLLVHFLAYLFPGTFLKYFNNSVFKSYKDPSKITSNINCITKIELFLRVLFHIALYRTDSILHCILWMHNTQLYTEITHIQHGIRVVSMIGGNQALTIISEQSQDVTPLTRQKNANTQHRYWRRQQLITFRLAKSLGISSSGRRRGKKMIVHPCIVFKNPSMSQWCILHRMGGVWKHIPHIKTDITGLLRSHCTLVCHCFTIEVYIVYRLQVSTQPFCLLMWYISILHCHYRFTIDAIIILFALAKIR